MPTPPLSDDLAREAVEAWLACGRSQQGAAELLGLPYEGFRKRLKIGRARGFHLSDGARESATLAKLGGLEVQGGHRRVYDKETGRQIDTVRYTVPKYDLTEDALERMADRFSRIVAVPNITRPTETRSDVLNFIPLFDVHLGQRVGAFGTAQAVERLRNGFRDVMDRAPPAETVIIVNGGDFTEANDNSALTPQSKHPMAVDTDFDDIADIVVDVTIDLIEYAMRRCGNVIYQPLRGNHDHSVPPMIRQGLRQRYRDNPRFQMKDGHRVFTHAWEGNFLAAIHGDEKVTKPETLALSFAERYTAEWCGASNRELWRGHRHSEKVIAVPGMRVHQVNAICPPGRYANDNLFTGDSDIQVASYYRGGMTRGTVVHKFGKIAHDRNR